MATGKDNTEWLVRMRCVVIKELVVSGCTEEQAAFEPYDYCVDETECEQEDWEVLSVKANA